MSYLDPVPGEPTTHVLAFAAQFEATYGIPVPRWAYGYTRQLALARDKTWRLVDNFLRPIGRDFVVILDKHLVRVSNDESLDVAADQALDAAGAALMALETQATRLTELAGRSELMLTPRHSRDVPWTNSGTRRLLDSFAAADRVYGAIELCRREKVLDAAMCRSEANAVWTLYRSLQADVSAIRHQIGRRMADRPNYPPYFSHF